MPLTAVAAGLIGGLASTGASIFTNQQNIQAQQQANAFQDRRNRELYQMQRADALSDWNMQNAYNSPSQQMQRYKEAGLNPNLIYGQMTNSPVVRSTEAKPADYVAPQIKGNPVAEGIQAYQNIRQMELQSKGLESQILESQARREKLQQESTYQHLQNQNLVDNSPNLKEVLSQKVRMNDYNIRLMEQNIEQNQKMNPLQQDLAKSNLLTLSQNRYWQALTEAQKNEVAKAQVNLFKAQEDKTIDEADLIKMEYNRLLNFGINRNFVGDLIKIIAAGLLK